MAQFVLEATAPAGDSTGDLSEMETAATAEAAAVQAIGFPLADPWAGRALALAAKRTMDIVGAIAGMVLASPIFLGAAVAVLLDSPGPILYRQKRVGRGNKEFTIYKFRTMIVGAEENGPQWADPEDQRATRIGRILRLTRIDELPQLWNVLRGEMSLVGPRPERKCFIRQFVKQDPKFALRTVVKPGITGWAQVNGGYELGPIKKMEFDLAYIEQFSMMMDMRILARTVGVVIRGDGAR